MGPKLEVMVTTWCVTLVYGAEKHKVDVDVPDSWGCTLDDEIMIAEEKAMQTVGLDAEPDEVTVEKTV